MTLTSLRDRLRIEAYLAKFAWPMQDYPPGVQIRPSCASLRGRGRRRHERAIADLAALRARR